MLFGYLVAVTIFLSGKGESVVPLDFEASSSGDRGLYNLPPPCLAQIFAMDGAQVPVTFFEVTNVSLGATC